MPTYEYRCSACGHEFEQFQSITADPIQVCPACGKKKVQRLLSGGAGVIFKGSGFYITDYRSDSYKNAAKAESGGSSGGDKKSEGGSAAKSEPAKSDAKPAAAKSESPAASTPAPKPPSKDK